MQLESGGKCERRASPRLAFHGDRSTHQCDQLFGDGQAESGPTVSSGGGPVRLGKGVEYAQLGCGGNSDSGIGDGKAQLCVGGRTIQKFSDQSDAADLRKLDGIAQKIHENLAKAHRVAFQVARNPLIDLLGEFKLLASTRLHEQFE